MFKTNRFFRFNHWFYHLFVKVKYQTNSMFEKILAEMEKKTIIPRSVSSKKGFNRIHEFCLK